MTFTESYKKWLFITNYFSIPPVLWILGILLLTFPGNLNLYFSAGEDYDKDFIFEALIATFFQIPIFLFLTGRLVFIGLSNRKFIWTSQILWLIAWLILLAYQITSEILSEPFIPVPGCDHCYPTIFIGAFFDFQLGLGAYLFLSPIKQISTLVFVYFYRK